MRGLLRVGSLAVAGLLATAAQAENIKIGIIEPYSGTNADLGEV